MRNSRAFLLTFSFTLLVLLVSSCSDDSEKIVNPPPADTRTWTMQESAYPLVGVWGVSGSDVFAVGTGGTIMHYNGSAWSFMSSGTFRQLVGVWGSLGSDVFAVGFRTILHYNGSAWSDMSSATTQFPLSGVWGTSGSDVFAVGTPTLILHYAAAQ